MSLGAVFPWCTHIMFSFLTRHFDVLLIFPFVTFLVPLQFKWYYSQLVKQTDQKEETAKSSETVQCQREHIFKGHRGDLLWQHVRLKLTLLCNKNKLNWENIARVEVGAGRGWNASHHKQLQKVTEARESQRTREGRIIRDRMKLTEMQTEIHRERVKQNLGEMQFGEKIGAKYTGNDV